MLATLLFLFSFAFGATYDVVAEIDLDQIAPSPAQEVTRTWHFGTSLRAPSAATFDSDWSYMKCRVTARGSMLVEFYAASGNYPTTFPSTVTCEVDHKGDTYQAVFSINDCTDDYCERLPASAIPNCSTLNNLALGETQTQLRVCTLPDPPTGYSYALPANLRRGPIFQRDAYYFGRWQKGGSPSADDAEVPLKCSLEWRKKNSDGSLFVRLHTLIPATLAETTAGSPYYCPLRLMKNSDKSRSWSSSPIKYLITR